MKIVSLNKMKEVQYFGNTVHVPDNINFIGTDQNGTIMGFEKRPVVDHGFNFWDNPTADDMYEIGMMDLDGTDWTTTLQEV